MMSAMPKRKHVETVEVPRDLLAMLVMSSIFSEAVLSEVAEAGGPAFVAYDFAGAVLDRYDAAKGLPPRGDLVKTPLPSEMNARLDALVVGLGMAGA